MLLKYGRINSGIVNEDNILAYRAQAFGGIIWLEEPLMKYRIHSSSDTMGLREVTADNHKKQIVKSSKSLIAIIQQIYDDSRSKINLSESLLNHLSWKRKGAEIDLFLFDNYTFKSYFLTDKRFYYKGVKKLFFNFYWILIREKEAGG